MHRIRLATLDGRAISDALADAINALGHDDRTCPLLAVDLADLLAPAAAGPPPTEAQRPAAERLARLREAAATPPLVAVQPVTPRRWRFRPAVQLGPRP